MPKAHDGSAPADPLESKKVHELLHITMPNTITMHTATRSITLHNNAVLNTTVPQ